jgi:hypothetical protein
MAKATAKTDSSVPWMCCLIKSKHSTAIAPDVQVAVSQLCKLGPNLK